MSLRADQSTAFLGLAEAVHGGEGSLAYVSWAPEGSKIMVTQFGTTRAQILILDLATREVSDITPLSEGASVCCST